MESRRNEELYPPVKMRNGTVQEDITPQAYWDLMDKYNSQKALIRELRKELEHGKGTKSDSVPMLDIAQSLLEISDWLTDMLIECSRMADVVTRCQEISRKRKLIIDQINNAVNTIIETE